MNPVPFVAGAAVVVAVPPLRRRVLPLAATVGTSVVGVAAVAVTGAVSVAAATVGGVVEVARVAVNPNPTPD